MKIRSLKKLGVLTLAMLFVLPLGGCGEEVWELTDTEEEQIVTYAAHIVSKYNKTQTDGITRVIILPEEETEEETVLAEEPESEPSTEGFYAPEEFADLPTTTGTDMDAVNFADSGAAPMELNDVLMIDGFTFAWTDTKIMDDFLDSTSTMLFTPDAGKRYVLLTISVTNVSGEERICDIPEVTPEFQLIVNGNERLKASMTLSSADFQNFQETVGAGETVDTVLFFQRKASEISDSDSYSLEVTLNGVTGKISEK